MGILAVLFSGFLSAFFGLGYKIKTRIRVETEHTMTLFFSIAALLCLFFGLFFGNNFLAREVIFWGSIMGICMFSTVFLYFYVIQRAQLNISWTAIQMSIVVPLGVSILLYGEVVTLRSGLGIIAILFTILFFGLGKKPKNGLKQASAIPDLKTGVVLFFSSLLTGMGTSVPKIYAALDSGSGSFSLVFYGNLIAAAIAFTVGFIRGKPYRVYSRRQISRLLLLGLYMGSLSAISNALIVSGLYSVNGSIAYPLRNIINLVFLFFFSFFVFRERATKLELLGVALAIVGIALISSALAQS